MYCPHCGVRNAEETKFCRGCGEDLRLVLQAVTRSLPLMIAHRVDEAIDRGRGGWRSYQVFRGEHRKPFGQILMGLASLFVIFWILMLGHGSVSFAGGFLLVMSLAFIVSGIHELWEKKWQVKQAKETAELPSTFATKELVEASDLPRTSVTESTTRRLKVEARPERRDQ